MTVDRVIDPWESDHDDAFIRFHKIVLLPKLFSYYFQHKQNSETVQSNIAIKKTR